MQRIENRTFKRALAILLVAFFVFTYTSLQALAQEANGILPLQDDVIEEELEQLEVPDEVVEDREVTADDLGVRDPRLLPDSPFYPIKEGWRAFQHAFAFSDVADARLDLKFASEKLLETKKLAERGADSKAIGDAIANYEKELRDFNQDLDDIIEDNRDDESVVELQELAIEVNIEHTALIDDLGKDVSEDLFIELEDAKDHAQNGVARVLSEIGRDQERVREAIARAATKDKGSKLRSLKALEVLKAIEQRVPEEARGAINQAQENIYGHFQDQLQTIPEDLRLKKLEGYMKHMPGDATRRLAMLDDMKFKAELPEDVIGHIEVMKAKAVEYFNEKFKKFESPEAQDRIFEHLKRGELEDIRVFDDLRAHALDKEVLANIERHEKEGLDKFREAFARDDSAQNIADRAEQLMRQMRDHPDPKTFRLLEDLRNELPPEQRKFVDQMEDAGQEEMRRRFEKEQDKFFHRMNSINPKDFAFMDEFKDRFGAGVGGGFQDGFDQTIDASVNSIQNRISSFDHPEDVEQFRKIFDGEVPPEAKAAIRNSIPNFSSLIEEKRKEVSDKLQEREAFVRDFRGTFEGDDFGPDFIGDDRQEFERQIREKFRSEFNDDFGFDLKEPGFDPSGRRLGPPDEFPGFSEFDGRQDHPQDDRSVERRIDQSLIQPDQHTPKSSVTCSQGLVWVPDSTRPAGGICAREFHSCPTGQFADSNGRCINSPTSVSEPVREPFVPEPTRSIEPVFDLPPDSHTFPKPSSDIFLEPIFQEPTFQEPSFDSVFPESPDGSTAAPPEDFQRFEKKFDSEQQGDFSGESLGFNLDVIGSILGVFIKN